jgi:hypothetical protein
MNPKPTLKSSGRGPLKNWWGQTITNQDLNTPELVEVLCRKATAAGVWQAAEIPRLHFFAWAHHCARTGKSPGGLFVRCLGQPDKLRKPFAARFAAEDIDWARAAIRSIDLGHPAATRTADLFADGPDGFDAERKRQIARLEAIQRKGRA